MNSKSIYKTTNIVHEITIPPSKSYTHRALILSSLADGVSTIKNALWCDDTRITTECLRELGFHINTTVHQNSIADITVHGSIKSLTTSTDKHINIGESGTSARFFTALCSIMPFNTTITASKGFGKRPMSLLIKALTKIGVKINYLDTPGILPIKIYGGKTTLSNSVEVMGNVSSQYISALLLIAPLLNNGLQILITGKTFSKPYIKMTIDMMRKFGINIDMRNHAYKVSKQEYSPQNIICEGDYSSASYFIALVAIMGGESILKGINRSSIQGDVRIIDIAVSMGCKAEWLNDSSVIMCSRGKPKPINIDLGDNPDLVPSVAVMCAFSKGTSKIKNIEHLKFKESNRITSLIKNFDKIGVNCNYTDNKLIINGQQFIIINKPVIINTYNDHRIAMAFTILGLKIGNIIIDDIKCVRKSFPTFWNIIADFQCSFD